MITFKADKLQTITFKLPSGVKLVNVTTGKTSAAGASVEISGGTQFYLTAPLDQAESVSRFLVLLRRLWIGFLSDLSILCEMGKHQCDSILC